MSKAYIWTPKARVNNSMRKYKHIAKKLWHKAQRAEGKNSIRFAELPITVETDY